MLCVTLSMIGLLASLVGAEHRARRPRRPPGVMRTVVDMAGRHVQIPTNVTRVATNIPLIPPTIYIAP